MWGEWATPISAVPSVPSADGSEADEGEEDADADSDGEGAVVAEPRELKLGEHYK